MRPFQHLVVEILGAFRLPGQLSLLHIEGFTTEGHAADCLWRVSSKMGISITKRPYYIPRVDASLLLLLPPWWVRFEQKQDTRNVFCRSAWLSFSGVAGSKQSKRRHCNASLGHLRRKIQSVIDKIYSTDSVNDGSQVRHQDSGCRSSSRSVVDARATGM